MTDRKTILLNLLNFSDKINDLKLKLGSLPWDYDGPPIIFTRAHLLNVLRRFLMQELDKNDVENWANLLECREDIDFEENYTDELSQMIYQLANPELEGELDTEKCKELIDILTQE